MSIPIENLGEIIKRIIYLESFENRIDKTNKTKRTNIKEAI